MTQFAFIPYLSRFYFDSEFFHSRIYLQTDFYIIENQSIQNHSYFNHWRYLYNKLGLRAVLEDETNDSRRVIEGIVSWAKFDFGKKFRKQSERIV